MLYKLGVLLYLLSEISQGVLKIIVGKFRGNPVNEVVLVDTLAPIDNRTPGISGMQSGANLNPFLVISLHLPDNKFIHIPIHL